MKTFLQGYCGFWGLMELIVGLASGIDIANTISYPNANSANHLSFIIFNTVIYIAIIRFAKWLVNVEIEKTM